MEYQKAENQRHANGEENQEASHNETYQHSQKQVIRNKSYEEEKVSIKPQKQVQQQQGFVKAQATKYVSREFKQSENPIPIYERIEQQFEAIKENKIKNPKNPDLKIVKEFSILPAFNEMHKEFSYLQFEHEPFVQETIGSQKYLMREAVDEESYLVLGFYKQADKIRNRAEYEHARNYKFTSQAEQLFAIWQDQENQCMSYISIKQRMIMKYKRIDQQTRLKLIKQMNERDRLPPNMLKVKFRGESRSERETQKEKLKSYNMDLWKHIDTNEITEESESGSEVVGAKKEDIFGSEEENEEHSQTEKNENSENLNEENEDFEEEQKEHNIERMEFENQEEHSNLELQREQQFDSEENEMKIESKNEEDLQ